MGRSIWQNWVRKRSPAISPQSEATDLLPEERGYTFRFFRAPDSVVLSVQSAWVCVFLKIAHHSEVKLHLSPQSCQARRIRRMRRLRKVRCLQLLQMTTGGRETFPRRPQSCWQHPRLRAPVSKRILGHVKQIPWLSSLLSMCLRRRDKRAACWLGCGCFKICKSVRRLGETITPASSAWSY